VFGGLVPMYTSTNAEVIMSVSILGVPQPPGLCVALYGCVSSVRVTRLHLPEREADILGISAI
jgi:hypothetical protein